ncbi:MAG TPA: sulfotransferase [Chitinophagales bacterium]|nr:sulfotransferase [Chitinophagales bacterium]
MRITSKPLLIVGTQRSGSNLLRLMLNQLPEIEAPHPPHLLQIFSPLLPLYGDLKVNKNFTRLVSDIADYVNANPVAWHDVTFSVDEIMKRVKETSLTDIFRVVYQIKAEKKNARYWCCKSMANIYYIPEIESAGWQPYYIHLLRDGRDVAASFKNSIVGEKHVYFVAKQWKQEQELSAALARQTPANRFCLLRYEEFITNPKQALAPILQMLELNWTDEILNFYLSDEAKRTAASGDMWRNVVKPVDAGNKRHYSEKLTPEEIELFESVAGHTLELFGYKRDYPQAAPADKLTAEQITQFALENDSLKKEAQKKYVVDARVRVPQQEIIKRIKTYTLH